MEEIDRRIERAARAMARHRLGGSVFAAGLPSEQARSIHEAAVERLWPSLVDEARAVVEAIDADIGQQELARSPHNGGDDPPDHDGL